MTLLLGLALADVIESEPYDCPRGSAGMSNHNGPWCEATTCSSDSDCRDGKVCSDDTVALCVETTTLACGGLWDPGAGAACTETRNTVVHRCGAGDQCVTGTCSKARRCAYERRGTPPVTSTSGKKVGGCQTSALGGLLLALAGLLGRRR